MAEFIMRSWLANCAFSATRRKKPKLESLISSSSSDRCGHDPASDLAKFVCASLPTLFVLIAGFVFFAFFHCFHVIDPRSNIDTFAMIVMPTVRTVSRCTW